MNSLPFTDEKGPAFNCLISGAVWNMDQLPSINRIIMEPTSLHKIVSRSNSPLREDELAQLFVPRQYPRFELRDLSSCEQMQNSKFSFFVGVLRKWNERVGEEGLSQMEYRKNEFIFSWLKSIAVQNSRYLDASLSKVYEWYFSNSEQQVVCQVRRENANRSRLEDWEIRNSYKSNMPLEINHYRRRNILNEPFRTIACDNQQPKQPGGTEAFLSPVPKSHKKENNYIRGVREEREMTDYLTNYRRTKVNFFKNITKNYYRRQFSKDKLERSPLRSVKAQQPRPEDLLKSYRIKTAAGTRPFGKRSPTSSLSQTASSQFYRPDLTFELQAGESALNSPEKSRATKIDGLGLLVNPFEVKPKKKRR